TRSAGTKARMGALVCALVTGGTLTFGPELSVPGSAVAANEPVYAAAGGGRYLVVWTQSGNGLDVRGALIDPASGTPPTAFTIAGAASDQAFGSPSFDGARFVIIWNDTRRTRDAGTPDIYGARVELD